MENTMLIVGAGIAGLSTGYYARLNGFDVTIFESNSVPGGLCAAWSRKGYTFDLSMHMLTGSKSGAFNRMWRELGIVGTREFCYHTALSTIEWKDRTLSLSADAAQLRKELLSLSAEDAPLIEELIKLYGGPSMMNAASLKAPELYNLADLLKMGVAFLPLIKFFRKYGATTIQEFAQRFRHPLLRDAVRFLIDGPGWPMYRYPMAALAGFGEAAVFGAGTPVGGSHLAIEELARRYTDAGGRIRYKSRAVDVIVDNDRATGIRLEDGSEARADHIVWAADGHHLIFDILSGKYLDDRMRRMYEEWKPVQPMVHVMLGVGRDLSKEAGRLIRELEEPIEIAGEQHRWIAVVNHSIDPTTAPRGKSAIEVWYATSYGYWEELYRERERYRAEKERIANATVDALEKRWPGISAQIEVREVATPMTYVRYTGNWQGSPDGWYITPENMRTQAPLRSLPGLEGLSMVGQWTAPFTGTVMAALSGRQLIELLCRKTKRRFATACGHGGQGI